MKKIILLVMLMVVMVLPSLVSATFPNTAQYCTNINVTVGTFTYHTNTPIVTNVNFTVGGTTPLPYNESIRIYSLPCNSLGTELKSALIPLTQNTTGHVEYGRLVIIPNGTVTANITYGAYYNYTATGLMAYSTDLQVTSSRVQNTFFKDVFRGAAINETRYLPTEASGTAGWAYGSGTDYYVDGLLINGATALGFTGTCTLTYNSSIAVAFNCVNGADSMIHYYYGYSYFKDMYPTTSSAGYSKLIFYMAPNGLSTNTIGYFYNRTTTSEAGHNVFVTRGIVGGYSTVTTAGSFYLWNNTNNNTQAEVNAAVINAWPGGGAAEEDDIGNSYLKRAWITGADNATKITNASEYWRGYIENPIVFNTNPIWTEPGLPALIIYQYANMSNIDNHSIVWKLNIVVFNNDTTTLTNVVVDGANNFSIANYTIASLASGASNLSQFAYNLTRENITIGGIDRIINLEPARLVGNATGSSNALTIVNPVDPPSKLLGGIANCWTQTGKLIIIPIACTLTIALNTLLGI